MQLQPLLQQPGSLAACALREAMSEAADVQSDMM
jgi:hypothetical protein